MTEKPSSDDQTSGVKGDKIDRKTLIVSVCFLLIPPVIPLYFLKDAQAGMGQALLVGLSLVVFLGNGLFVLVLLRWLGKMKRADDSAPPSPGP